MIDIKDSAPSGIIDLLFDPQTSGGLLIAVPGTKASTLLAALQQQGIGEAAIIGEVVAKPAGRILVR
jgi:selenide,water dikinase